MSVFHRTPASLLVAMLYAAAPAALVAASNSAISIERSVPARAGGTLTIDAEPGGTITITSWDRPEVSLSADLAGRDARDTRIALAPAIDGGARLDVHQERDHDYSTGHRFRLLVPSRYSVRVNSGGGDLSISNLTGRFAGNIGGGQMLLTNLTGEARLTTGGGAIVVADSTLSGRVQTGGGNVTLRNVRGPLEHLTGGGRVYRTGGSGETTDGRPTRMVTGGGAIELDSAPNGASLTTGGGDIRLRSAGGPVNVTTGGGDIRIETATDTVRATTGSGDVAIGTRGSHDVTIATGNGTVELRVPASLQATFDIETSYGRNHAPVRIRSDFPLDIRESPEFETRGGNSPRKYVTGTGRAGAGTARIKIRAAQGDIRIVRV